MSEIDAIKERLEALSETPTDALVAGLKSYDAKYTLLARYEADHRRLVEAVENVLERCKHMDRSKPIGDWYYNEITGAIERALGGKV